MKLKNLKMRRHAVGDSDKKGAHWATDEADLVRLVFREYIP
jgi:hypothetical protein